VCVVISFFNINKMLAGDLCKFKKEFLRSRDLFPPWMPLTPMSGASFEKDGENFDFGC
jgi:hypothetical protein